MAICRRSPCDAWCPAYPSSPTQEEVRKASLRTRFIRPAAYPGVCFRHSVRPRLVQVNIDERPFHCSSIARVIVQDDSRTDALQAQVSSLREQLHATYRMAEAMRQERDDAQTAIDQLVADHHEAQLESERQLSELQQAAQVTFWSRCTSNIRCHASCVPQEVFLCPALQSLEL